MAKRTTATTMGTTMATALTFSVEKTDEKAKKISLTFLACLCARIWNSFSCAYSNVQVNCSKERKLRYRMAIVWAEVRLRW